MESPSEWTAERVVLIVAGIALMAFAVAVAFLNPSAWPPMALAALVIGSGIAYAGWTGQTIHKAGPAGIELYRKETIRAVGKAIRGQATLTVSPPKIQGTGRVVNPEPAQGRGTAQDARVSVEDSGVGTDEVSVEKLPSQEEYERRAALASTPEELAQVILDVIATERARLRSKGAAPEEPTTRDDSRTDSRTDS